MMVRQGLRVWMVESWSVLFHFLDHCFFKIFINLNEEQKQNMRKF